MTGPTLRGIFPDELDTLGSELSKAGLNPNLALLLLRNDRVMAAGGIEMPDHNLQSVPPRLMVCLIDPDCALQTDLPVLLEPLIEQVIARGFDHLILGWDPMDHPGLKALEGLGFRPGGEMPYFVVGPGQIEYVSGYQDATGSTLDLVLKLPERPSTPEA